MDLEKNQTMTEDQQQQVFLPPPVMVEDDLSIADQEEQQQMAANNNDISIGSGNNQFVLDMATMEDSAEEAAGLRKPQRKMTSTSEATSVTATSSYLDDRTGTDDYYDDNLVKPRLGLGSLDETPEASCMEGEGECDNNNDDEMEDKVPDSCCYTWFKRIFCFFIIFGSLAFFTILIGAAIEKKGYSQKEGTAHLYQNPQVCAVHDPLTDTQGLTIDSVADAHEANLKVAHCGDCGACSTAEDMRIMSETAESLTGDTTRCAFKIFLGIKAVEKCMEDRVGFTPACEDCWLDNISCSFKSCKFSCIKYKLFRQDNNNDDGSGNSELNDCLKCDERMCGPGFIECSGSNRRRMGIVSDIGRNSDTEQCTSSDVDWMTLFQKT